MSSLQSTVLCLSIGYAALGILLLTACLFTHLPWPVKAGAIAVTSAFYVSNFFATRSLLGWSSDDPLPPKFKLLSARIVEPHTRADDPGSIYLWVEAIDENNFPATFRAAIGYPIARGWQKRPKRRSGRALTAIRKAAAPPISAPAMAAPGRLPPPKRRQLRS